MCHIFSGASLKSAMETAYSNSWIQYIKSCASTGKLTTYSKFKNSFQLENYISQFPLLMRRNLTKLRISAHNLAIETSRYRTKSQVEIPVPKRLCFHFNGIKRSTTYCLTAGCIMMRKTSCGMNYLPYQLLIIHVLIV